MSSAQDEADLSACLQGIYNLTKNETKSVINEGYNKTKKLRHTKKASMSELFYANMRMSTMKTAKHQNMRVPRALL